MYIYKIYIYIYIHLYILYSVVKLLPIHSLTQNQLVECVRQPT